MKKKQDRQNSRYDHPETSKDGEACRRHTVRILLNKWQKQKEKDLMCQERNYWKYQEIFERRRIREENKYHWICPFFQYC